MKLKFINELYCVTFLSNDGRNPFVKHLDILWKSESTYQHR